MGRKMLRKEVGDAVRSVTEQDLRLPEFRDGSPEDYEFENGKIVRKDRWKTACETIRVVLGLAPDCPAEQIAAHVEALTSYFTEYEDLEEALPKGAEPPYQDVANPPEASCIASLKTRHGEQLPDGLYIAERGVWMIGGRDVSKLIGQWRACPYRKFEDHAHVLLSRERRRFDLTNLAFVIKQRANSAPNSVS